MHKQQKVRGPRNAKPASHSIINKEAAPHPGLPNLGNTCYIGCVLQVLFFCPNFRHYLITLHNNRKEAHHGVPAAKKRRISGDSITSSEPDMTSHNTILARLVRIFDELNKESDLRKTKSILQKSGRIGFVRNAKSTIDLHPLLRSFGEVNERFMDPRKQQDVQEFLCFLLATLHDLETHHNQHREIEKVPKPKEKPKARTKAKIGTASVKVDEKKEEEKEDTKESQNESSEDDAHPKKVEKQIGQVQTTSIDSESNNTSEEKITKDKTPARGKSGNGTRRGSGRRKHTEESEKSEGEKSEIEEATKPIGRMRGGKVKRISRKEKEENEKIEGDEVRTSEKSPRKLPSKKRESTEIEETPEILEEVVEKPHRRRSLRLSNKKKEQAQNKVEDPVRGAKTTTRGQKKEEEVEAVVEKTATTTTTTTTTTTKETKQDTKIVGSKKGSLLIDLTNNNVPSNSEESSKLGVENVDEGGIALVSGEGPRNSVDDIGDFSGPMYEYELDESGPFSSSSSGPISPTASVSESRVPSPPSPCAQKAPLSLCAASSPSVSPDRKRKREVEEYSNNLQVTKEEKKEPKNTHTNGNDNDDYGDNNVEHNDDEDDDDDDDDACQHNKRDTLVEKVFQGSILSSIRCLSCHNVSRRHDMFYDLSLTILQNDKGLVPSLAHFVATEKLQGSNKYKCENCQKMSDATREFKFSTLPPVLTIHLKRFSYNEMKRKVSDHVECPMELNLRPFTCRSYKGSTQYELFAVILHKGSYYSGHYTTLLKQPPEYKELLFEDEPQKTGPKGEREEIGNEKEEDKEKEKETESTPTKPKRRRRRSSYGWTKKKKSKKEVPVVKEKETKSASEEDNEEETEGRSSGDKKEKVMSEEADKDQEKENMWMFIDDEKVSYVSHDKVKSFVSPNSKSPHTAYILFYAMIPPRAHKK